MKQLSPEECRDAGYLLEVNRRFFHPLGLALAVNIDLDGSEGDDFESSYLIYDYRDDPEGVLFGTLTDDESQEKILNVLRLEAEREPARQEAVGFWIQPTDCDVV